MFDREKKKLWDNDKNMGKYQSTCSGNQLEMLYFDKWSLKKQGNKVDFE